jgi:chromosome segregation ATPase
VIETIMIFALGFFVSTLLGLMIVPALNERADRLARRRVEAQLPASVAELNAERDTLRAELAVRERRIEQRLDGMRAKQAADMAELGRRTAAIVALNAEGETLRATITGLETDLAITRNALADSEARAAGLSAELLETREALTGREAELADLQARHETALADLDSRRIRISDLETRLEAETGRAREIERVSRRRAEEIDELRGTLERTRKALADEEARGAVLERRVEDFARSRDEALAAQARSETALTDAGDAQAAAARDLAARHAELEKASARIAALEGHLALSERRLAAADGEARAAQEAQQREIEALRAQKASLQGALDHARSERQRIEKAFSAYRADTGQRIDSENKLLRERIDAVTRLIMGEPAWDAAASGPTGETDTERVSTTRGNTGSGIRGARSDGSGSGDAGAARRSGSQKAPKRKTGAGSDASGAARKPSEAAEPVGPGVTQ